MSNSLSLEFRWVFFFVCKLLLLLPLKLLFIRLLRLFAVLERCSFGSYEPFAQIRWVISNETRWITWFLHHVSCVADKSTIYMVFRCFHIGACAFSLHRTHHEWHLFITPSLPIWLQNSQKRRTFLTPGSLYNPYRKHTTISYDYISVCGHKVGRWLNTK